MKKAITTLDDINILVKEFYAKARKDQTIGYIFNEVMTINWEEHIPTISSFWESVLFGKGTYRGNPMLKHIALNAKEPLTETHFNQWIKLWEETVNEHFEGTKAEEAKTKARSIKELMVFKIKQSEKGNFIA